MAKVFKLTLLLLTLFLISCGNSTGICDNSDNEGIENYIALDGADNMRDLGGYTTSDCKVIKDNMLFRSDNLSALTDGDKKIIEKLSISTVIDLRTPDEIDEAPDNLPDSIDWVHYPLAADVTGGMDKIEFFKEVMEDDSAAEDFMIAFYQDIDEDRIANWIKVFDEIEKGDSVLWHCTSGKDRAGMTSALLLRALGVDSETIMQEYLLSNKYLADSVEEQKQYFDENYAPGAGDQFEAMFIVKESYLEAFFDKLDKDFDGIDNFIKNVIKIDVPQLKKLYLQ